MSIILWCWSRSAVGATLFRASNLRFWAPPAASTATKVSPTPSSNCFAFTLLASSQLCIAPEAIGNGQRTILLRRTRHDPRESVVPHQTPHHGWLEERLDDASSIAHRIHLFAGRAGNSEYSLGTDESRPSAFRCNWKSPVSYGQFRRGSDTFRRGPR